jgi:hypothetical protein
MTGNYDTTVAAINARAMQLMLIEARLKEAARILKRLPDQDSRFLYRVRAKWPDFKPETFDEWIGYQRIKAVEPRLPATAAQITRTEECLFMWLPWLRPKHISRRVPMDLGVIVMARSVGMTWNAIGCRRRTQARYSGGNSHVSLRRMYKRAIATIADRLERQDIELKVPDDWEDW